MMRAFICALSLAIIPGMLFGPDLTTYEGYIESGHYSSYVGNRAFDNTGTAWYSSESGAGVNGVSWIGQHFGTAHEIRRVGVVAFGYSSYDITSYIFEYSDNGSDWLGCGTVALTHTFIEQYANFDPCGSHTYWRILANSGTGSSYWYVHEIEMFEYVQDATFTPAFADVGTLPASGAPYAVQYTASYGEIAIVTLLIVVVFTIIYAFAMNRIHGKPNA